MTAASATILDQGHTVTVRLVSDLFGAEVRRSLHFDPVEAVAVYEALHEWVNGND